MKGSPVKRLRKLNDICLFVKDLEESERFYTEKLGFTVKRHQPGYVEFDFDGTSVTLWKTSGVFAAIDKEHLGGSGHHFMLAVRVPRLQDVDEIAATLKTNGVTIISAAQTYPWGARALYFTDNEGNIWEVFAWEEGNGPGLAQ
jgi:hypothetical protein